MRPRARSTLLSAGLVVLAVASGCAGGGDGGEPPEPEAGAGATTGTLAEDVEPALVPFAEVPQPIALSANPGTGDLYVAEREGRVHLVDVETGEVAPDPVIDISDDVSTGGERGLLGIAIDPEGDHLYLSYTDQQRNSRIDRFELDGAAVIADSRREVLGVEQPFPNHNGGEIAFGPDDLLYVGLGDGGSGGDPQGHGQNPSTRLGSILRIDPDDVDPGDVDPGSGSYSVPADNPFVEGGGAPEVWLFGVRNPWRFSFDRETGDLWIGDVGQDRLEEIDHLPNLDDTGAGRGVNLGWGEMEGTEPYEGGVEPDDHVAPVFEYVNDDENCAVTGGYVYRGRSIPDLEGLYLFGDFCAGRIRYLRLDDGGVSEEGDLGIGVPRDSLVSFGEDLDGELYVLSIAEGVVYRIEPADS